MAQRENVFRLCPRATVNVNTAGKPPRQVIVTPVLGSLPATNGDINEDKVVEKAFLKAVERVERNQKVSHLL